MACGCSPNSNLPTTDSESTHRGVTRKAWGPGKLTGTQEQLPQSMTLKWQHLGLDKLVSEECQPCDFGVTPWPCDKAVHMTVG